MPRTGATEVSAGGVVARRSAGAWEVCMVRAGRHWGLPKGHLEGAETPQQAALREISEECGLPMSTLSVVADLPAARYAYQRNGLLVFKVVHHFLVMATGDTPARAQEGEIDQAEWLPFAQARAQASFAATRSTLDSAADLLHRHAGDDGLGHPPP